MIESVNVLGQTYRVVLHECTTEDHTWGKIVYEEQVIYICPVIHEEERRVVLLHEILHCLNAQLKLGLQEANTARLAQGLFHVFTNNRDLRALLEMDLGK